MQALGFCAAYKYPTLSGGGGGGGGEFVEPQDHSNRMSTTDKDGNVET